jgi:hypothetical protein
MGVIFKSLLILLSNNSSDITADSVWTFVPGFMFLWDSLVVSLVPPWQQIICSNCRRLRFDPWLRKIPWRSKWQCSPVFCHGKSHGQRSQVGYQWKSWTQLSN